MISKTQKATVDEVRKMLLQRISEYRTELFVNYRRSEVDTVDYLMQTITDTLNEVEKKEL